jgi:hypothetical protein
MSAATARAIAFLTVWPVAFAGPLAAETLALNGQYGVLGEWELTATVTKSPVGGDAQWSGPLSLRHVGFCSFDGPEEKTGQLRLNVADPPGRISATLVIDGVPCTFSAQGRNDYHGLMTCPDRRDVPIMLSIE